MAEGIFGDRRAIAWSAAFAAAASAVLVWPGTLNPDTAAQLDLAVAGVVTDRGPPVIARLITVGGSGMPPGTLLLLSNIALFWLGSWAAADGLWKTGRVRTAWILLALALSPLMLYYQRSVWPDIALASTMIAAFGILFRDASNGLIRRPTVIICIGLGAYACLVRVNGTFAAAPLLALFAFSPRIRWSKYLATVMLFIFVGLIGSTLVNKHLLMARPSGIVQGLQLYDLVGIAYYSGDETVIPNDLALSLPAVARCYNVQYWDPLTGPVCGGIYGRLPPPGSRGRAAITVRWMTAIARHPIAYAEHRLAHFNSEVNFLVPALQCRFAPFDQSCGNSNPVTGRMIADQTGQHLIAYDYLKKSAIVWPALWLALAVGLLITARATLLIPGGAVVSAMLVSAIIYGLSFALVGVATNIRYFLWPMLAVQGASVLLLGLTADVPANAVRRWSPPMVLVAFVLCGGYMTRLLDLDTFMAAP